VVFVLLLVCVHVPGKFYAVARSSHAQEVYTVGVAGRPIPITASNS
jgi:hypothetical protein